MFMAPPHGQKILDSSLLILAATNLESKQEQESHHQTEQPHSLRQGKTKNGEGEKLALQGGIPGIANNQGAKDTANSSTRSGNTNSSSSSTNVLGSLINVIASSRGLDAADLVGNGGDRRLGCNVNGADAAVGSNVGVRGLLPGSSQWPQSGAGEQAHASSRGLGNLGAGNHLEIFLSPKDRR